MDNARMTELILQMAVSIAKIEANTSCIPKLEEDFDKLQDQVRQNTEFREGMLWYRRLSIGAIVTSLIAAIVAFLSREFK